MYNVECCILDTMQWVFRVFGMLGVYFQAHKCKWFSRKRRIWAVRDLDHVADCFPQLQWGIVGLKKADWGEESLTVSSRGTLNEPFSVPGFPDWLSEEPLKCWWLSCSLGERICRELGTTPKLKQDGERGPASSSESKDLSWFGAKVNVQRSAAAGSPWLETLRNTGVSSGQAEFIIYEERQKGTN